MLADTFVDVLGRDAVPCSRDDVDVRTGLVDWAIEENKPDWVVNCAALTDEDWCEDNLQATLQVNTWGAINVANACRDANVPLVHIRSCHEIDLPNIYGLCKALAHTGVKRIWGRRSIIAMTGWFFGSRKDNQFVSQVLSSLSNGHSMGITDNNYGTPTYTYDFVRAVVDLMRKRHYGQFTIANLGRVTRWAYASAVCNVLGVDNPFRINNDYEERAPRPFDCSLETTIPMRPYEEALREAIGDKSVQSALI
jgi:dTDP-4-dehydrorhamnose reductase